MDKKQTNKTFISLQTSIYTGHRKWNEIYSFLLNLHKFTTISGIAWKQKNIYKLPNIKDKTKLSRNTLDG